MAHTEAEHNHGFTNKAAEGTRSHRTMWAVVSLLIFLAIITAIYLGSFNYLGFQQSTPPNMDNNRTAQP